LALHEQTIQQLQADSSVKIYLFSAADNGGLNPFYMNDISFPHQVELKVNLDEVKANLRGLKNKPGTTRPADITGFLRKIPKYDNEIRLTYALTHKVGISLLTCICVQDYRIGSFKKGLLRVLTQIILATNH
jgi:E3 SUMO-protein ligase PIAS1